MCRVRGLSVEGIIPAAGVAAEVTAIILYAMVLLVAVTVPIHTLVAFRPAARLPSLFDAERARAAAKRRPPIINAGGPQDWRQDCLDHLDQPGSGSGGMRASQLPHICPPTSYPGTALRWLGTGRRPVRKHPLRRALARCCPGD